MTKNSFSKTCMQILTGLVTAAMLITILVPAMTQNADAADRIYDLLHSVFQMEQV